MSQTRTSPRISHLDVGRRTGLTLSSRAALRSDDGLEDPEQLFEAVHVEKVSNGSVDKGKENDTTSVRAGSDAAVAGSKKPKVQVRFSLGEEVADQFDPTAPGSIKAKHPVRKLISASKGRRESIDTNDLSTVATASSESQRSRTEEDDVEASRQSSEETEIAAIVAVAAKQAQQQQSSKVHDFSMVSRDDDVGFDNDDFMPPPPPDSPQHVDEMEDEDVLTQPAHDNDVDFPNPSNDDDDDNDGPDFETRGYDDDDDEEGDETINEQSRRRKKKRLDNMSKKVQTAQGRKKKNIQSIHDESESEDTPEPKRKTKKKVNPFKTTFSPKGMPGPRTYTTIPLSDLKADEPEDSTLRRSKRVRIPPLEYWRGEKPEFGGNNFGDEYDGVKNMPVVIGIVKPDPTPYKKRKVEPITKKKKKKNSHRGPHDDDDSPAIILAEEPFDATELRQKFPINEGKNAHLWDERFQEIRGIKVVSYVATAKTNDLPMAKTRKKSEGKVVGKAAQSFQMSNEESPAFPGYIVGHLLLPPKGIKDAESVGLCAQVFTVVRGQANSVEVAYGDPEHETATWDPVHAERFLLSAGDNFLVPPGNSYRLQNHSTTTDCLLSWTIIRHTASLLASDEE